MNTGTAFKRIKRRLRKKIYYLLLSLNDIDSDRFRPVFYLVLIAGLLLAWAKLPTTESQCNILDSASAGAALAASIRSTVSARTENPVDIVALFLPQDFSEETAADQLSAEVLYSFYLTGAELSYLAEGAVTTVTKDTSLYLDGLNFTYHKNRLPFNRVTALSTASGSEVFTDRLYHIVSTEDIFALFHYISYRSIGIMKLYPKDASGSLLSDYQKVIFNDTGIFFTLNDALCLPQTASTLSVAAPSVVTMQHGFNLIDLIKEPNPITICVTALFIAFLALIWYIVPRIHRIRIWFRIYRIRSKKRSTHSLYRVKKRF